MSKENPVIAVDMTGTDLYVPKGNKDPEHKNFGLSEAKAIRAILKKDLFPEVKFICVGCRERIEEVLGKGLVSSDRITIVDAPLRIDSNASFLKDRKKFIGEDAATEVAHNLAKEGEADAVISGGNTAFNIYFGTHKSEMCIPVDDDREVKIKPALGISMQNRGVENKFCVLLDVGATLPDEEDIAKNVRTLLGNTILGLAFYKAEAKRRGVENDDPEVKQINIGEESRKGLKRVRRTHSKLEKSKINYGGMVEPDNFWEEGKATDINVTDGWTGNIMIKQFKGTLKAVKEACMEYARKLLYPFICLLGIKKPVKRFIPGGAAVLLGTRRNFIKFHGSSSPKVVIEAIRRSIDFVKEDILAKTEEEIRNLSPEILSLLADERKAKKSSSEKAASTRSPFPRPGHLQSPPRQPGLQG
jgi:fatty acid/phospholipid biosynthesis enzyme